MERLDIVWDRYFTNCLKSATRGKRGCGIKIRVLPDPLMPTNFKAFLRVDENKTALFTFLADQLALVETEGKVLISTKEENVVSKLAIPDPSDMLQPCTL